MGGPLDKILRLFIQPESEAFVQLFGEMNS
jgi:hypothetical protein